jgi:hypothetical protein
VEVDVFQSTCDTEDLITVYIQENLDDEWFTPEMAHKDLATLDSTHLQTSFQQMRSEGSQMPDADAPAKASVWPQRGQEFLHPSEWIKMDVGYVLFANM